MGPCAMFWRFNAIRDSQTLFLSLFRDYLVVFLSKANNGELGDSIIFRLTQEAFWFIAFIMSGIVFYCELRETANTWHSLQLT